MLPSRVLVVDILERASGQEPGARLAAVRGAHGTLGLLESEVRFLEMVVAVSARVRVSLSLVSAWLDRDALVVASIRLPIPRRRTGRRLTELLGRMARIHIWWRKQRQTTTGVLQILPIENSIAGKLGRKKQKTDGENWRTGWKGMESQIYTATADFCKIKPRFTNSLTIDPAQHPSTSAGLHHSFSCSRPTDPAQLSLSPPAVLICTSVLESQTGYGSSSPVQLPI